AKGGGVEGAAGGSRAVVVEAVQVVPPGRARAARVAVDLIADRVVLRDRLHAGLEQRCVVDEGAWHSGEAGVAGRRRPAGKVVRHLVVVDGGQDRGRGPQVGECIQDSTTGIDLVVLGAE